MKFEISTDVELIRKIATSPWIYPHISDDFSPNAEDWQPPIGSAFVYLIVYDEQELLGMWTLYKQNAICWEIHTCLLPNAWGKRARVAGKEVIDWIFENTDCLRIVTNVPDYNRLAFKYAIECGLIRYGLNPASYMKDGKLHNQILLGISKCLSQR